VNKNVKFWVLTRFNQYVGLNISDRQIDLQLQGWSKLDSVTAQTPQQDWLHIAVIRCHEIQQISLLSTTHYTLRPERLKMDEKINGELETHVGSKFVQDAIRTFIGKIYYLFMNGPNSVSWHHRYKMNEFLKHPYTPVRSLLIIFFLKLRLQWFLVACY
jgi:23S rRNA maturation-related 3'-5' exoribonuclease YhaM